LDELNRKIDKNIWMTVPNSYLYQRQYVETDKEKKLKDERMAEYKKKAEEGAKGYNKQSKDTKKETLKVEKPEKEVLIQKFIPVQQEMYPLDPKTRERLMKIHIGVLDDPKSIDIMF
jgi:hypothetical protein